MHIAVTEHVLDYKGNEISDAEVGPDGEVVREPATVRSLLFSVLNTFSHDELPGKKEKRLAYELTNRIYASDVVEFTIEEANFIKDRLAAVATPIVMGRISDLLEAAASSSTKELDHVDHES